MTSSQVGRRRDEDRDEVPLVNVVEAASPWEGGPLDMVRRPDFYMLWLSAFALQSGGLFLTTNLGSIVAARDRHGLVRVADLDMKDDEIAVAEYRFTAQ